tara:strand:- start:1290 stop:3590 length:2301 start_codon:yes stop_codon:yes gene_type:complete
MSKSISRFTNSLLTLFIITLSTSSVGQQIDPSILSQLSPDQIKMVREAYTSQNSTDIAIEDIPVLDETLEPIELKGDVNRSEGKYGYDFFTTMATSTSAVGDLPLPNDYKISFRDQLTIILSGSRDSIFDLSVKLDGTILFPELGSVYVVDKTLGEVKDILAALINNSYIGVQIDVSLKNLSAKKITIVGAVNTPGTFLVNPFSTITSALAYSGGVSKIGTLRNIKLIRKDGTIFLFDLYDLLIKGDRSKDITIEAGDTILIEAAEQFVTLTGEVRRPAIYEVLETETIEDLVIFGLGFTEIANISNLSIKILDLQSTSILQKTTNNLKESLKDVINLTVYNFGNEEITSIQVLGAVEEPGFYELSENNTLDQLIGNIKFNTVYPWLAALEQFDKDKNIKSSILFNINDQSTFKSIRLLPNAKVTFLKLNDRNPSFIELDGLQNATQKKISEYSLRLNHKGDSYDIPVYGKFETQTFIDLLGLDMSDIDDQAIYVSPLENKIEKVSYASMEYTSTKYNTITFKSPVNDLVSVTIEGAVLYPGKYTLNSNSTLQDLYNLAGEFKNNAFFDGIIYIKENQKNLQKRALLKAQETLNESILVNSQKLENEIDPNFLISLIPDINEEFLGRVTGSFSPNSRGSLSTTLNDGDSIFVPIIPNAVSVFGEVLNPSAMNFIKNMKAQDAIDLAGGYKEFADKKNIYVIKANGTSSRMSRNIFINNIVLEPGDTIIVPRKILINSTLIEAITPVTQILSNLAFSAAAIENLSNN